LDSKQELLKKIEELKRENYSLKKEMESYEIEEHSLIGDIEYICYKTIEDLKKLADSVGLTAEDSKILDTVHRNLRLARGEMEKKVLKGKELSKDQLLKIVETSNKKKKA